MYSNGATKLLSAIWYALIEEVIASICVRDVIPIITSITEVSCTQPDIIKGFATLNSTENGNSGINVTIKAPINA